MSYLFRLIVPFSIIFWWPEDFSVSCDMSPGSRKYPIRELLTLNSFRAAYCLVNLEAAITFLETVDLASLRSDEPLSGPPKPESRPTTPHMESRPQWISRTSNTPPMSSTSASASAISDQQASPRPLESPSITKPTLPTTPSHQRKLSNLFQPPASALGAASDVVRTTADQGFKTIGNTLDNSFKLLFGRLKEHKLAGDGSDAGGMIIVPRTLDDARRLVEPPKEEDDEEEISLPSTDLLAAQADDQAGNNNKSNDSLLNAIVGRKQSRDRSVDSVQSSGSGKRVAFAAENNNSLALSASSTSVPAALNEPQHAGNVAVESMRSLGNTLNPLKGFGSISVIRGFGRSTSSGTPTPTLATAGKPSQELQHAPTTKSEAIDDQSLSIKVLPPIQRYMDVASAEDLKVGEVAELLKDYKRLAGALKNTGAF